MQLSLTTREHRVRCSFHERDDRQAATPKSTHFIQMDPNAKLRPQTVLQQMLEEINFQRTKEMRQMLKDGKTKTLKTNPFSLLPIPKPPISATDLQTAASSCCRAPHIGPICLCGISSSNRRRTPTTPRPTIFSSLCARNTSRARHGISRNTM